MFVREAGNYFEGENGVYYSEPLDMIFILEDKRFELLPVKYEPPVLMSAYVYTVSNDGIDRQKNTTVNRDLKLQFIGNL